MKINTIVQHVRRNCSMYYTVLLYVLLNNLIKKMYLKLLFNLLIILKVRNYYIHY